MIKFDSKFILIQIISLLIKTIYITIFFTQIGFTFSNDLSYIFLICTIICYYIKLTNSLLKNAIYIENIGKEFTTINDLEIWQNNFDVFKFTTKINYLTYIFSILVIAFANFQKINSNYHTLPIIFIYFTLITVCYRSLLLIRYLQSICFKKEAPSIPQPPTFQLNQIENIVNTPCSICLEINEKHWSKLPCQHQYHTECILNWLTQNPNCPICRAGLQP